MKTQHRRISRPAWALLLVGATLASSAAVAASNPALSEAQLRYQQERTACISGQSNQERSTCLREAGAALAEARRGALSTSGADLLSNQLRRCEPLPTGDREDCVARIKGHGTTSGSVAGGGIYRELVTREPVVAPPVAKDAPPR